MSTLRPAAPARMAWRFGQLFEAPHRLAFAAGTLMLALTSLWWALVNLSGVEGMGVRWAMPPATAHSVLMTFGFMPFFFAYSGEARSTAAAPSTTPDELPA